MSKLTQFRAQIDNFFKQHPQSPLDASQQLAFERLDYFEPNKALVFEVDLVPFEAVELIEIPTTGGIANQYRRLGQITFDVNGQSVTLTVLSNPKGKELFIPFRDATSGKESYGGGRYLDDGRPGVVKIGRNRYRIDFNFAYNPWCAYSPDYSCPLPPHENWLTVPISAGEKAFTDKQ